MGYISMASTPERLLINATQPDLLRLAITETKTNLLQDYYDQRLGQEQKKANIYKAVIKSISNPLGAVFVDYDGGSLHGFLSIKDISPEYFLATPSDPVHPDLNQILKVNQALVVQVDKEARGKKGAALTTFISLAGAFLVLMPNNPKAGGISRRIEGEDREQLRGILNELNISDTMGLIVRTAGVGRTKEELDWDLNILLNQWEAIKQAAVLKPGPYLIHQESNLIRRAMRDYIRPNTVEIVIDNEEAFQEAKHYMDEAKLACTDLLRLYKDPTPLFTKYETEKQIEETYQAEVRLPSGGSLVINHTEALVAIDVNSSRATRGANIEETAFQTNREAAEEVARQLRIRDIGGLIIIDFIDMLSTRNQREVEAVLRSSVRPDRAQIQTLRISRLGLLEMSRQRLRTSITRSSQTICPCCKGQGIVRSVESLSVSILYALQDQASVAKNVHFQLHVPNEVAAFLLNEKRHTLQTLETTLPIRITVIANEYLDLPQYIIKQVKSSAANLDHSQGTPSYQLSKNIKTDVLQKSNVPPTKEPAIQQFLSPAVQTTQEKSANTGLFRRLMKKMFGSEATDSSLHPKQETKVETEPTETQVQVPEASKSQRSRRSRSSQSREPRSTASSPRSRPASSSPRRRPSRPRRYSSNTRTQQQPGQPQKPASPLDTKPVSDTKEDDSNP